MDVNQGHFIVLGQLDSVTLIGSNNIFGILSHLMLPGLTHLYLRSSLESPLAEETGDWITLFLERSSPPLSLLEIRDLLIDSACLERYLQLSPSLQELRLHDVDINDAILQLLNAPDGLCPYLTRLDFRWCGRLTGRALVALVQSRLLTSDMSRKPYPTAKSIEVVTLINCSFVKEQDIIDLGEMTVCRLILREQDDHCGKWCYINFLGIKLLTLPLKMDQVAARTSDIGIGSSNETCFTLRSPVLNLIVGWSSNILKLVYISKHRHGEKEYSRVYVTNYGKRWYENTLRLKQGLCLSDTS